MSKIVIYASTANLVAMLAAAGSLRAMGHKANVIDVSAVPAGERETADYVIVEDEHIDRFNELYKGRDTKVVSIDDVDGQSELADKLGLNDRTRLGMDPDRRPTLLEGGAVSPRLDGLPLDAPVMTPPSGEVDKKKGNAQDLVEAAMGLEIGDIPKAADRAVLTDLKDVLIDKAVNDDHSNDDRATKELLYKHGEKQGDESLEDKAKRADASLEADRKNAAGTEGTTEAQPASAAKPVAKAKK